MKRLDFPNDIIEAAPAHSVGTKVEQAYRRKTGFEKRRLLAEAWGELLREAGRERQRGEHSRVRLSTD